MRSHPGKLGVEDTPPKYIAKDRSSATAHQRRVTIFIIAESHADEPNDVLLSHLPASAKIEKKTHTHKMVKYVAAARPESNISG